MENVDLCCTRSICHFTKSKVVLIIKLVNVPSSLNNLKTNVDGLDVGKLKTVPVRLKKLSDVVDNEIVKNTKFKTLKIK